MTGPVRTPIGTFCLVLHTHLPWVAHAGAWPVGEEWLHQAFTGSWRRVLGAAGPARRPRAPGRADPRRDAGARGDARRPVLPARAAHLGRELAAARPRAWPRRDCRDLAAVRVPRGHRVPGRPGGALADRRAVARCCGRWSTPGSSSCSAGRPRTRSCRCSSPGSRPARSRPGWTTPRCGSGRRPAGIWAPECGHAPGQEDAVRGRRGRAVRRRRPGAARRHRRGPAGRRPPGRSAFGRDLEVSYRVWSPRAGLPGRAGLPRLPHLRPRLGVPAGPGDRPARAARGQEALGAGPGRGGGAPGRRPTSSTRSRGRLRGLAERDGRPGLVVAAFDTELFGHWWHEGPAVARGRAAALPAAGVRVTTLRGAVEAGHVGRAGGAGPRRPGAPARTGGSGTGPAAQTWSLAAKGGAGAAAATPWTRTAARYATAVLDQLAREALLALSSDWAFMVSHDSAAGYARERAAAHAGRVHALADLLDTGDRAGAEALRRAITSPRRPVRPPRRPDLLEDGRTFRGPRRPCPDPASPAARRCSGHRPRTRSAGACSGPATS